MGLNATAQQSDSRSPNRVHRTASGKSRSRGRSGRAEKRAEAGDRRSVERAIEKDSDKRAKLRAPKPVEEAKRGEQIRDERIPARLQIARLTTAINGHFDEYREKHVGEIELPPATPETMRESNLRARKPPKRRARGE